MKERVQPLGPADLVNGVGNSDVGDRTETIATSSATYKLIAALFDVPFYLKNYPHVQDSGLDPIVHYLDIGWKEGYDPSPSFSTTEYLEVNPEVRAAGDCPLIDYVTSGITTDRSLRRPHAADPVRQKIIAAFDVQYYLETNPDIRAAGIDPLEHYLTHGWLEHRNPSSAFSTKLYLEANQDVKESGLCPLVHYVTIGAKEGRLPRPINPTREAMSTAVARNERVKPWLRLLPPELIDKLELKQLLSALKASQTKGIVLGLSQDDYGVGVGGVQICVSDEESLFRRKGWAYLHLCPAQPLPVLAEAVSAETFIVSVRANGMQVGIASIRLLIDELAGDSLRDSCRVLVLHHLMGFSPEHVDELARSFAPNKTIAWIHDLFTLCPSWAMFRNNVAFCGGPPVNSQACDICVYGGAERRLHLARMAALFDALNPDVLAPSDSALAFWLAHGSLKHAAATVVPHGRLMMGTAVRPPVDRNRMHLKIGFAGGVEFFKGWHVFEELASRHFQDSRYSFYHFGAARAPLARNIEFVRVAVKGAQRHGMTDALIANGIDVIINWSLCHETFSFAAHEALAAGTFVVARNNAGNIVPAISQNSADQGLGLDTVEELFNLFATGELFELMTRRRYGEFHVEPGTVRYLEGLL